MYEDLVKALRLNVEYRQADNALENASQAADAIESLSKELMDLKMLTCSCCEVQEENGT